MLHLIAATIFYGTVIFLIVYLGYILYNIGNYD